MLRVDVPLEIGASTEAVTVSAESTLLKTESGDMTHNITLAQLDNLPLLGIGNANSGSSGIRNPYNAVQIIPGVSYTANSVMVVNGAPNNTAAYRIEGMDNTNHTVSFAVQENQPSPDAVQEMAIQTSNYAAEFGAAGGGLINIVMKSGTNQYHGSGYDYFVNEDLNAAQPFSNSTTGNIRPRNRRNDYGGTLGGPIWIPKVYDGHNRTFFFFNFEEFRESSLLNPGQTLPIDAFRNGDFSSISPNGGANFNRTLGVTASALPSLDGLGRQIFANTIYDPATRATNPANGVAYANPFPGNMISPTRFDPTSVKIQALIPPTQNSAYTNNADLHQHQHPHHGYSFAEAGSFHRQQGQTVLLLVDHPDRQPVFPPQRKRRRPASHHHAGPRDVYILPDRAPQLRPYADTNHSCCTSAAATRISASSITGRSRTSTATHMS